MPRKKETITLSIPPGIKERLEELARKLGIFWGKSPSISGLLVALAECKYEIGEPFTLSSLHVAALRQGIRDLMDAGHVEDAAIISSLLLERGNLEPPMRQELWDYSSKLMEPQRQVIDQFLDSKQPFLLLYHRKGGQPLEYRVRYGKIRPYDKRLYLDIWCDEVDDNRDIPQLAHNRCLRLDRIAAALPITGVEWRDSLDSVEVHLHLLNRLAENYETKEDEDIYNEMVGPVRHLIKRVSHTFWLFRDVLKYGGNCEIISPPEVRQRFIEEQVKALCRRYQLELRD